MLAFLAIVAGTAFIILSRPPHSVCDSQMEVINTAEASFLFKDPKTKLNPATTYERLRDQCKTGNSPGGCYEFFQELKTLMHDLGTLTAECSSYVAGVTEYKRAMWESISIIVRLAWGEHPPASYASKWGWLDTADISLFCALQARITEFYGKDAWDGFREQTMRDFPGSKDLPRNQIWDLSIFSENCARFP